MLLFIALFASTGLLPRGLADPGQQNALCVESQYPEDFDFLICPVQNPQEYIAVPSRYLAYQNAEASPANPSDFSAYINKKAALICKLEKLDEPYQYATMETNETGNDVKNVKKKRIFSTRVTGANRLKPWIYELNQERFDQHIEKVISGSEKVSRVTAGVSAGLITLSGVIPIIAPVTGPLGGIFGFIAGVSSGLAKILPSLAPVLQIALDKNIDTVNTHQTALSWRSRMLYKMGHVRVAPRAKEKEEINHWVFSDLTCKKYKQNSFMRFLNSLNPFRRRPGQNLEIQERAISDSSRKNLIQPHHEHSRPHGHHKSLRGH
jgi:hypothetical protein